MLVWRLQIICNGYAFQIKNIAVPELLYRSQLKNYLKFSYPGLAKEAVFRGGLSQSLRQLTCCQTVNIHVGVPCLEVHQLYYPQSQILTDFLPICGTPACIAVPLLLNTRMHVDIPLGFPYHGMGVSARQAPPPRRGRQHFWGFAGSLGSTEGAPFGSSVSQSSLWGRLPLPQGSPCRGGQSSSVGVSPLVLPSLASLSLDRR